MIQDRLVFPESATVSRVTQCTTGRVLLVEFKDSGEKLFFWLQEPKSDKDEEFITNINKYISDPSAAQAAAASAANAASDQMLQQMALLAGLRFVANIM